MSGIKVLLKRSDALRRLILSARAAMSGAIGAAKNVWITYQGNAGGRFAVPFSLRDDYIFENRGTGTDALLMVLAGYKEQLWEDVFGRIKAFLPGGKAIDVCVVTSGKMVESLRTMCKENGWSYLSTKRNNVSLVQNIAISLFPDAQWIYKLDEDIFITHGFFDKLKTAYFLGEEKFMKEVGFSAPIIPVNGYGYIRILKKLNLVNAWKKEFGVSENVNTFPSIVGDEKVSKFFWGDTQEALRGIDRLNDAFAMQSEDVTVCPYRFSIGAILFKRAIWKGMGMFPVHATGADMGVDEVALCNYCMMRNLSMVVSENCVVGHLSYGPQNSCMLKYHSEHRELFKVPYDAGKA